MTDFIDILLEARGGRTRPRRRVIKVNTDEQNVTDYSEEVNEEEIENEQDGQEDQNEDNEDIDQDEEPIDYTEEESELNPEDNQEDEDSDNEETTGDEDGETESGGSDEDGSTDYTEETSDGDNDVGDEVDNFGEDETEADEGGGSGENSEENNENDDEKTNKRLLLADFTTFYNLNRNVIRKLSSTNKPDVLINKIINQVKINLIKLDGLLFDYIVYQFPKESYVNNLYKYNSFIEAFRLNAEMLKKIRVLTDNDKT
jgi:hypothetical protein